MTKLTDHEKRILLKIAREAIKSRLEGRTIPDLSLEDLPETLREEGACFVTLTRGGQLRGCVGTLQAEKPLALDVQLRAVAAAFHDFRFPRLKIEEFPEIEIEISYLTQPEPLDYRDGEDLLARLEPGKDGLVLSDGSRRATFLPQVWEKLPEPAQFLSHLCIKMGLPEDAWRQQALEAQVYRVEEFSESSAF